MGLVGIWGHLRHSVLRRGILYQAQATLLQCVGVSCFRETGSTPAQGWCFMFSRQDGQRFLMFSRMGTTAARVVFYVFRAKTGSSPAKGWCILFRAKKDAVPTVGVSRFAPRRKQSCHGSVFHVSRQDSGQHCGECWLLHCRPRNNAVD